MMHSITIGDKNTWDDWHLVSTVVPTFSPSHPKTNYVEVPGLSGKLDFAESLTGYPTYDNRTGSFEFIILNELDEEYTAKSYIAIYEEMSNYLNGSVRRAVLEDDSGYFYNGRFWVSGFTPGSSGSDPRAKINIDYEVEPYKYSVRDSIEGNWFWDEFNFETGVIETNVLEATTEWKTKEYYQEEMGYVPMCPTFIVSTSNDTGIDIRFVNDDLGKDVEMHLPDGESVQHNVILYGGHVTLEYKLSEGNGTLSVVFRKGRL